jgi:NAD(P)H-dependent FMN reductase
MAEYGGYVFVTPEYNYGIAGSTKNAIDFLYHEILGKPALIVSYGVVGGQKASDALKTSLEGMKLRVAETRPMLFWHGGQGPDLYAAAGKGVIGEDTLKDWNSEKKEEVLKGVEEFEVLLQEEVAPRKDG